MTFLGFLHVAVFGIVVLSSTLFALVFLLRKKSSGNSEVKKSRLSNLGIVLQGASYAVAFAFTRSPFSPALPAAFDLIVLTIAAVTGVLSVYLAYAASTQLGKNWSLTAKIQQGHELVTTGVYGLVRHPIYTAMLLLLVSQALIFSHWWAFIPALLSFATGSVIRIREEEKLLRDAFGAQYDEYAKKVPALVPGAKCCCK